MNWIVTDHDATTARRAESVDALLRALDGWDAGVSAETSGDVRGEQHDDAVAQEQFQLLMSGPIR